MEFQKDIAKNTAEIRLLIAEVSKLSTILDAVISGTNLDYDEKEKFRSRLFQIKKNLNKISQ